jgi:hypothetical protein
VVVEVRTAAGSEYFVPFVVQAGSVRWSIALFAGRFSTESASLIPASASAEALCRWRLWFASVWFEVAYATAVVAAINSTVLMPIAMTSASPRSDRN